MGDLQVHANNNVLYVNRRISDCLLPGHAGEIIQIGKLAEFAPIEEIITLIASDQSSLEKGTAVLCVGLPMLKSGKPSSSYNLKLFDQEKDQVLELNYQVRQI